MSNIVWKIIIKWEWFSKKTVGDQLVRSVDSISAIIAEGFGRHFKKDKNNFYRMARGSVWESIDWTNKSLERKIISVDQHNYIIGELEKLPKEINQLISYTNSKLKE